VTVFDVTPMKIATGAATPLRAAVGTSAFSWYRPRITGCEGREEITRRFAAFGGE
jgi:hypothetical protein